MTFKQGRLRSVVVAKHIGIDLERKNENGEWVWRKWKEGINKGIS